MRYYRPMKQIKTPKRISAKRREEENAKVLAHFFEESSKIVNTALKETREKYPNLFKSS